MRASQLLNAKVLQLSLSKSGIAKREALAKLSLVGTYCRERKAVSIAIRLPGAVYKVRQA